MEKISYCKKCLLPSTKPNVKFNAEQICGACLYYEKKKTHKEYDVVKKNWGYYVTPSINKRLKFYGYSVAIIKNLHGKYFICIVNVDKRRDFYQYLKKDKQKIILWLKKSNLDLLEKINK